MAESIHSPPGPDWDLEDAEEAHRNAPTTFELAAFEERSSVQPGELVRLHFLVKPTGDARAERMWVEVRNRDGEEYIGYLTNQPACITSLRPGDLIRFAPRHIAQLYIHNGDPRWRPEGS